MLRTIPPVQAVILAGDLPRPAPLPPLPRTDRATDLPAAAGVGR